MGNCQAIDAAVLVIQNPNGKIERQYWPVPASEVMRMNPGHYVSLIIPLPVSDENEQIQDQKSTVRYTRVKLLRPSDTLALGHAYRLITSQEVMKVMRAKKYAKGKSSEFVEKFHKEPENQNSRNELSGTNSHIEKKTLQAMKHQERLRPRTVSANSAAMRSKSWRPSLQSIIEAAS